MAGPLDGVRIIDLTTIYSGPICTSILGDQGADVIKVESPEGDLMRQLLASERNGVGGAFAMMNRNKRSIVIDLRDDGGKDVFMRLIADADVVVENFRPGVMERLGIGFDDLQAVNPRLVFASINGVGHVGPYAKRRVYDAVIQAISGIGSLQSDPTSEKPLLVNTLICDKLTSMTAAQSIVSALYSRQQTGRGQRVDISMLDTALFFLWPDSMLNYTFVGDEVMDTPIPSHTRFIQQTKNGWVCTMPVKLEEWMGLLNALDLPNLFADERFQTSEAINSPLFEETVRAGYLKFDTEALLPRLEEHQVPFAKINARNEVINDPQIRAMNALEEFEHPIAGTIRQPRPPGRFADTPAGLFRPSPELGEQTRDVLVEAGFSDEEVSALRGAGTVR